MERTFTKSAALLAALLVATTASAGGMSQLIASAGLSETEAAGMTINEIYAHKINRETSRDERVTVSSRGHPGLITGQHARLVASAGLTPAEARGMSVSEVAAYKVNRSASRDERISVPTAQRASFDATAHSQLLAQAGLSADEAAGMTLGEVYAAKVNNEAPRDERQ